MEYINSIVYTAGAWILAHAVPIAGFIALCMQIAWLYYKIRVSRLEAETLKRGLQKNSKEDTDGSV
jgi:hypothetical protein